MNRLLMILTAATILSGVASIGATDRNKPRQHVSGATVDREKGPRVGPRFLGNDCPELPAAAWFTTVRGLPDCANRMVFQGDLHDDVDGDGIRESLGVGEDLGSGGPDAINAFETSGSGDNVTVRRRVVLGRAGLDAYLQGAAGLPMIGIEDAGLRDLDDDGDLDLVLVIYAEDWILRTVWVENTGNEAANRLAGDINRDGIVNAADLALLLADWTNS
jgi:hypothetical protein